MSASCRSRGISIRFPGLGSEGSSPDFQYQVPSSSHKPASVKGFGCRLVRAGSERAKGSAFESLQWRKPRPWAVRYEDFATLPGRWDRARRGTWAGCFDRDATELAVCCAWDGSGIATIAVPSGRVGARALGETGCASLGCRRNTIVMRYRCCWRRRCAPPRPAWSSISTLIAICPSAALTHRDAHPSPTATCGL